MDISQEQNTASIDADMELAMLLQLSERQTADAATTAHAIRNGLIPYFEEPNDQQATGDYAQYPQQPCGDTDSPPCSAEPIPMGPNMPGPNIRRDRCL